MENKVQYTVTLKDLISNGLSNAEKKAESLDNTLSNLGKTAIAAFSAYEAFNFVKDSVKAFDEAAQASALLDNTLQNTGRTAAGFRAALDEQATALMDVSRFDDDAITGAQKLLAAQKNISDELVMKSIPAIVDAASSLKMDLGSAADSVAIALAKPEMAARKLKSMNVVLNDEQEKTIKKLTETGQTAKAQAMIIDLISSKYKGAGKVAAETGEGPFIVLANKLGNVTESFGGVIVSLVDGFMPAIKLAGEILKGVTAFLTENKEEVKAVAIGVALAGGAFLLYQGYLKAAAAYTAIMTIAQMGLNAAISANPIGAAVLALSALGAILYYAWQKSETFRQGVYIMYEFVKTYIGQVIDYFKALGNIIMGAFTLDYDTFKKGVVGIVDLAKNAGEQYATAFQKGKKKGSDSFTESTAAATDLIPKTAGGGAPTEPATPTTPVTEPKGSPTTKATTITITIDKLVESLSVNTTNIQESTSKIRELVATTLTDALNDSQIIAGG